MSKFIQVDALIHFDTQVSSMFSFPMHASNFLKTGSLTEISGNIKKTLAATPVTSIQIARIFHLRFEMSGSISDTVIL